MGPQSGKDGCRWRFGLLAAAALAMAASSAHAFPFGKKKDKDRENEAVERVLIAPAATPLAATAAYYAAFRRDLAALEAMPVASVEETRAAHEMLATHDPGRLSAGIVAFAALTATENPAYVAGLQEAVDLYGKEQILEAVAVDPRVASDLPGADAAAQSVLSLVKSDAARMLRLGERFETRAREIATTSWGKTRLRNQQSRVDEIAQLARARLVAAPALPHVLAGGVTAPVLTAAAPEWRASMADADAQEAAGAQAAAGAREASGPQTEATHAAPLATADARAQRFVDRVLALATVYAVNGGADAPDERFLDNPRSRQCLVSAKLNLDQCIAASSSPYEATYCLGRHGLSEAGGCFDWVAAQS
ncbi:MAG: hypothetical protein Tsb0010_19730 [Parvularculaceae bacterium]